MPKFSRVQLIVSIFCLLIVGSAIWFGSFGDEQENIAAGWLMSQGLLPYRDFFFHHTPVPFFISRLLFPFAQYGYWLFRVLMLALHLGVWVYLAKLLPQKSRWAVVFVVVLAGLAIPTLLLQMFLADTLASFALILLASIWAVYFSQKSIQPKVLFWVSIFAIFISVWSSITTILSVGVIVLTVLYMLGWKGLREFISQVRWPSIFSGILVFLSFPLLYALTGNWSDFYWSVFEYNNSYYLQYRLIESDTAEHTNFISTVTRDYFQFITTTGGAVLQGFYRFILTLKGSLGAFLEHKSLFLLGQHLAVGVESLQSAVATYEGLAVITLTLLIVTLAIFKRKWLLPVILLSLTLRSRTNEIFHLSPFYLCLWLGLCVVMVWACNSKRKNLLVLCGAVYISWCALLLPGYIDHLEKRTPIILPEMQQQAEIIKKHIQPTDTLLVLGGNTMYYPLTERLPATRQMYYLPWFAIVPQMHDEVLETIEHKNADVVLIEDFVESYEPSHFAFDIAQQVRSEYVLIESKVFVATSSTQQQKE